MAGELPHHTIPHGLIHGTKYQEEEEEEEEGIIDAEDGLEESRVVKGYVGQPKGVLQTLFERGLYKVNQKHYTISRLHLLCIVL
jgi:hypothetical protein